MQSQIRQKPIFIPIINQLWTPNHFSIKIVKEWFEKLYGPCITKPVDTHSMTTEAFKKTVQEAVSSEVLCFYVCVHGKQRINPESGKTEEYLRLNDKEIITDTEFTQLIKTIPYKTLLMFNESCHGGGILNELKIDDRTAFSENMNVVIINACSKEQKCYVNRTGFGTVGLLSGILCDRQINPFSMPEKALQVSKALLPRLDTKITVMKNIS